MALRLTLADLIRATLPQGMGHLGFIGFSPQGDDYHILVPVDLVQAQVLSALSTRSDTGDLMLQGGILGGRPGWRYLPCRTYLPPPPCGNGRPDQETLLRARRAQAQLTAEFIAGWAKREGWWVNVE